MIKFDKKAMQKFNQIPDDIKSKILSNVYCSDCKDTVKIIIESANFDPVSIRRTSSKFNLRTDASVRHEKSLDLERPVIGLARFLHLLKKIMPEAEVGEVVSVGQTKTAPVEVKTNIDFITSRLGQDLSITQISGILSRLGFTVKTVGKKLNIRVPHWRATGDVSIPEDIVEEVGRIYGYDNLGAYPLKYEMDKAVYQPEQILQEKMRNYLSQAAGLYEVYNYPWTEDRLLHLLGFSQQDLLKLANPPATDSACLQNSLLPNLLAKIEYNSRFFSEFGLFEMARVFKNNADKKQSKHKDKLPRQPKYLAWVVVGEGDEPYFSAKGILEGLFAYLHLAGLRYDDKNYSKLNYLESDDQRHIIIGTEAVGYVGSLSLDLTTKLDLKNQKAKIAAVELDLNKLIDNFSAEIKYNPLPLFPSVVRDLAFELDKGVKWQAVQDLVFGADDLIKSVEFLSIYDLGEKKSLAFRVEYLSSEKTLTSEEVEIVENKIIKLVKEKLKGNLRG